MEILLRLGLARYPQSQSSCERRHLYACLLLAALLSAASPAHGADTTWIGGTGSWFVPSNWSNGLPIITGGIDSAYINNGGTAQILSSGAVANFLELGIDVGQSGSLDVNGGGLTISRGLYLGAAGSGTLTIRSGGTVAGSAHVNGLATVDCGTWMAGGLSVGFYGTGTLVIRNGGGDR
jgi:fibronectin-binding autotransporter adhesin